MKKPISVTQLNRYIKGVFEDELILSDVAVFGEVEEFRVGGNNTYLTLKDGDYRLKCIRFGITETIPTGQKIILYGSVNYYAQRGTLSFKFTNFLKQGEGTEYAAFLRLKSQLMAQGIFDNNKPMPSFINSIAVITSADGAVIHDMMSVFNNRNPFINIDLYDVKVQGAGADREIAQALKSINKTNYSLAIVARGGGSEGDLSCFNTESVARAVFECPCPVISAVGHETNYTLCDFAATLRVGTPSLAAEVVARINEQAIHKLISAVITLGDGVQQKYNALSARITRLSARITEKSGNNLISRRNRIIKLCGSMSEILDKRYDKTSQNIRLSAFRLSSATEALMKNGEERFKRAAYVLDKLSPIKLLGDGYAKAEKDGEWIKSVKKLNKGDNLNVYLSDGKIRTQITAITEKTK